MHPLASAVLLAAALHLGAPLAGAGPKPGEAAPALRLPGLAGSDSLNLRALRGSVVLVDFWASWCLPCKKLMPELKEIAARHPQVKLVTISVDDDGEKARKFLHSLAPGLYAAHDADRKAAEAFDLQGMPASFLVDRRGNLRFRHDGYTQRDLPLLERQLAVLEKEREERESEP